MKNLLAITIPILPGKTEQFTSFTNELKNGRSEEFRSNRKKLGVRERTFLQKTPQGDFVIVTLEGENPAQAFETFGKGTDSFTTWFLNNVKEIHGMDLSNPPEGALPELIIDSEPQPLFA